MNKTALVPIANGSEEIEAVCIIDVLRRAGVDVTVASVEDTLEVTASRRTKLVADRPIGECVGQTYDLIALPGGMPGAERLRDCVSLIELLKAQREAGRLYGAICAAPVVALHAHGLLAGRKATAHPSVSDRLPDQTPVAQRVVVDGSCITSRGPGTAIEFALALVGALFDQEQAAEIGKHMLVK
ncbi:MAG: DJ-1/PfpI family protein [Anaerolineae bacterium]|nr:DJ-1/PfpI family protein [Anaerolineae bacterium]